MANTIPVEYCGPFDEIEVAATGLVVKRGEIVELYPNLAGRAPSTTTDADGNEVVDPGEGLLAQADTWRVATKPKPKPSTTSPTGEA